MSEIQKGSESSQKTEEGLERCRDCTRVVHDYVMPNDVWLEVMGTEMGGVYCYDCFSVRARQKGFLGVFVCEPLENDTVVVPKKKWLRMKELLDSILPSDYIVQELRKAVEGCPFLNKCINQNTDKCTSCLGDTGRKNYCRKDDEIREMEE